MIINEAQVTAAGPVKMINQDSIMYIEAGNKNNRIALAIVCDGMGGEQEGEIASASAIHIFYSWFCKLINNDKKIQKNKIQSEMQENIIYLNKCLCEYGKSRNIRIGTTISAMFILPNGDYIIAHVGDSRIYMINHRITQLTDDMSLVAKECKEGSISLKQSQIDKRRNILLECVGITETVKIQMKKGHLKSKSCILLCSDGFYHENDEEIIFTEIKMRGEKELKFVVNRMLNRAIEKGETDNISAIIIELHH